MIAVDQNLYELDFISTQYTHRIRVLLLWHC